MYPYPPQGNQQSFLNPGQDEHVQNFLQNYGSPNAQIPPQEAQQYYDRFAQAQHPEFHQAMGNYMAQQMDPNQFAQGVQNLPPQQKSGLIGTLMNALQSRGVDVNSLANRLGLSSTDPNQMQPQDMSALAGYAQQNAPEALQQTAQEHSSLLKTALGHPFITGALGLFAAHKIKQMVENREDQEQGMDMGDGMGPGPDQGPDMDQGPGAGGGDFSA